MENQPARPREPSQLGSYELVRKLARGGMAELYLARMATGTEKAPIEKLVVVKRILPKYATSQKFVRLFLDEASLAASLNHANIVQVYDIGNADGADFFTMEFLHGQDLRAILHRAWRDGRRIPIAHAVQIAGHVASALHYAHEKRRADGTLLDIVHRDVSPSNVIVSYDGAVKLVDFGVAKAATSSVKTRTGTLKGKIAYMSPEQAKGAPIDRRSDIFALGIVLWEMVTTQRLFRAENDLATLQLVINQAPKRPSEVVPDCPPELERIILKALAQDLSVRYATAEEVRVDLEKLVVDLGLSQSSSGLATFVQELFGAEVASWHEAQAAGVQLGDHLTRIHGGDLTTPVSESDFVAAEDLEDHDDDEDDDDEEKTEHLESIAGVIVESTRPPRNDPSSKRTASPDAPTRIEAIAKLRRDATPVPKERPGTPPPVAKADAALFVDSPKAARRDPTVPPARSVSPLAFVMPKAAAERPSNPSVSPVAAIAKITGDVPEMPVGRIATEVPPVLPTPPGGAVPPTDTGPMPIQASPWQAQGSSPQTPASAFPAAHGLMRDVPLLQDMAHDRAMRSRAVNEYGMTPEAVLLWRKRLLYIGGGVLLFIILVAITCGGGGKAPASSAGAIAPDAAESPAPRREPKREPKVVAPKVAPAAPVPAPAPAPAVGSGSDPAPEPEPEPEEVEMDPESATPAPAHHHTPTRDPKKDPKKRRFDRDSPLPP